MACLLQLFGYFLATAAILCGLHSVIVLGTLGIQPGLDFLIPAGFIAFVAGGLIIAFWEEAPSTGRSTSYLFLLMVWLLGPVFMCLPLYMAIPEFSFADAYFETVSMFTTTGFTLVEQLDAVPKSILIWRAWIAWLGGAVTIVSFLVILAPAGVGGLTTRKLRAPELADSFGRHHLLFGVRTLIPIYVLVTFFFFIVFDLSGLTELDALPLALGSVSTAGVMVQSGDVSQFGNPALEIALTFAMIFGAVHILMAASLLSSRRQFFEKVDDETRLILVAFALLGLTTASLLLAGRLDAVGLTTLQATREGFFLAASLISTTGYELREGSFTILSYPIILLFAFVGGASMSTAGGIKVFRVQIMLQRAVNDLKTLVYPHGMFPHDTSHTRQSSQWQNAVWASASAFALLVSCISIAIASVSPSYMDSLVGAVAVMANFGPLFDSMASAHEHIALTDLSWVTKSVMIVGMIFGRVEILIALALVNLRLARA